DEHDVLDRLVRHLDPPANDVVPDGRALVRHAKADRALVDVRLALLDEPLRDHAAALHRIELEANLAVPVEPEPAQRALDLLDRLGHLAARVRVLDPKRALASGLPGDQPVAAEGPRA